MDMARPDWQFPYAWPRLPVFCRRGVACSQPLAAQAGLEILQAGGNAVDAAIAAAVALTVVEPNMNGIGSDAFALVWAGGRLHGLDASGRAPAGWTTGRFAGLPSMPVRGWNSVTVPGCVSAWVALSTRFGRLPFQRLFAPAIGHARRGFAVGPVSAASWARQAAELQAWPDFARDFLPGGAPPAVGSVFRCDGQADALEEIATTRGESFYRGALARSIVRHAEAGGAALCADDLAAHVPEWVEPLALDFQGVTLHEMPPAGQGIAALEALGILARVPGFAELHPDSAASVHLQVEAMKLAFADVHARVADRDAMTIDPRGLLEADYLERRARQVDPSRAQAFGPGEIAGGGTVYLTAADDEGGMVSFIQSNYMGFGSGIVVPGTGIALQNRGACFTLDPAHPNRVAPGKRPFHTILPGFVTRKGAPLMSFGVMGAIMQPQGHVQMLVRMALHGQNPQAACDAPRWQVDAQQAADFEAGFGPAAIAALRALGHRPPAAGSAFGFGGAQLLLRLPDGRYCGASDPRKDGLVAGD